MNIAALESKPLTREHLEDISDLNHTISCFFFKGYQLSEVGDRKLASSKAAWAT
jgi:hypothetical protein